MNKLSPKKLLHSKWTAIAPINKEKHFVVTEVEFNEDNQVIHCLLEAVMSKRSEPIKWHILSNSDVWVQGWK